MCADAALLKRGGLKRMKAETKESVEQKIKDLRKAIALDKADKIAKPKRKAGENGPANQGEAEDSGKAGGQSSRAVRFWDVPEKLEAVDYTKQEDVRELMEGPSPLWGIPDSHQERPFETHCEEDIPPACEGLGEGSQTSRKWAGAVRAE